jgi:hypothetical protein
MKIGGLRDIRTQLLIVAGILLVIDLAAVGLLLSPAGRGRTARQQAYELLRRERIEKAQEAMPVQGMDQKIATARDQETQFAAERVAARYSAISEQLSRIASEAGVTVSDVKYDIREEQRKAAPPGYDAIGITILVHGNYAQDIRFVNAVERQKMMLLIDAVSFGGMEGGSLTVSVHLSTYLRSAA